MRMHGHLSRSVLLICAAWPCAVSGFHLPLPGGKLFSPELRAACSELLQVAVSDTCKALETATGVKGWLPEPHPEDDRVRLEALVASPKDRRLELSEAHHELKAATNEIRRLRGRAQELSDRGEHRAAAKTWEQYNDALFAYRALSAPLMAQYYAYFPDDVAERQKNDTAHLMQLEDEIIALQRQGKLQALGETIKRRRQLAQQISARTRKEIERRGDRAMLLNYDLRKRDAAANLPTGTTARLERSYEATPH